MAEAARMAYLLNEIPVDEAKKTAFGICRQFLGGAWKDITIDEFGFTSVSGGLSNTLYRCSLPGGTDDVRRPVPREVLYRKYGPLQQDDTELVVTEAATFTLLSERRLGPKLYGVFSTGRLEEFIPSRSLKSAEFRQLSKEIGREMAKYHALEVPIKKTDDFVEKYALKWIKEIETEALKKYNKPHELSDLYREELEWITAEMRKSGSPLVYCHNDLQGGNILLRDGTLESGDPKLMLIDFEFGAYNYRGFDIANQFCEWCFDYATEEFPHFTCDFDKFPTPEEQSIYIRAYLEQLVEEGALDAADVQRELGVILEEARLFPLAAHLLWSLWSEKMTFFTSMGFAHKEHSRTRRMAYFQHKEKLLRHCCNGENAH